MKVNLSLQEGTRFAVTLSMDVKPYCEAYLEMQTSRQVLKSVEASNEDKDASHLERHRRAKERAEHAYAAFVEIKTVSIGKLNGFMAETYWNEIKTLMQSQCDRTKPAEETLFFALAPLLESQRTSPLAVATLDTYFIELLKNSIDALLLHRIKGGDMTSLEMRIRLVLIDETLSIVITDNTGGFSESYLRDFATIVESGADAAYACLLEKRNSHDLCFGGMGRGLPCIARYMRGELMMSRDVFRKIYEVDEHETDFRIGNRRDGVTGAEITLTSPLKPFAPAVRARAKNVVKIMGAAEPLEHLRPEVILPGTSLREDARPGITIVEDFVAEDELAVVVSDRIEAYPSAIASKVLATDGRPTVVIPDILTAGSRLSTASNPIKTRPVGIMPDMPPPDPRSVVSIGDGATGPTPVMPIPRAARGRGKSRFARANFLLFAPRDPGLTVSLADGAEEHVVLGSKRPRSEMERGVERSFEKPGGRPPGSAGAL